MPRPAACRLLPALALGLLLAPAACSDRGAEPPPVSTAPPAREPPDLLTGARDDRREEILRSEALIRRLNAVELKALAKSVQNLGLPDPVLRGAGLFAESVRLTPLAGAPAGSRPLLAGVVEEETRPAGTPSGVRAGSELALWRPLLEEVDYFEHAKFYTVRGDFVNGAEPGFETDIGFDGLARLRDGRRAGYSAKLHLLWRRDPDADPEAEPERVPWRIHAWESGKMQVTRAPELLFEEALEQAIPDPEVLARVRHSEHRKYVRRAVLEGDRHPADWRVGEVADPSEHYPEGFVLRGSSRHPGVAVVDVDRDGFDDVYIMRRYGRSMLLHNRGDGTFQEIAADLGLDLEDHNSSGVFADFDNDGDPDLFLGRTLRRARYLVNEGGRFVDRSEELVDGPIPSHVDSVSVVDFNGDGLLDVYLSTYDSRTAIRIRSGTDGRELMKRLMLPPDQERELYIRIQTQDMFTDRPGPPNVLLENRGGGRFGLAAGSHLVDGGWRNTHQSTWGDYDNDGDPDLYVANDIAPNNFYRNDGGGVFVDVTDEVTADIGFGMGASWADYDADGWLDLYVTNMFSKAGRRLAAQSGLGSSSRARMARGNSLLRNRGDGSFERVSGLEPPALLVEKAGWGWGGQFADVDNDGYFDIYTLAGQHTGVEETENSGDT